ncbi:MAG: energy-coupling factor transporter transmembrane component T, partial [Bellilinea sp.]
GTGSRNRLARVRQVIPLILPLFLISLRRAETMALAMDARGYATVNRRTSMLIMRFTWKDGVAILFGVLAGAAVLFVG